MPHHLKLDDMEFVIFHILKLIFLNDSLIMYRLR